VGATEWFLLAMVIVIPAICAILVTRWSLEQAIRRNKKNRPGVARRRVAWPQAPDDAPPAGDKEA
jgi:hypothetical protein